MFFSNVLPVRTPAEASLAQTSAPPVCTSISYITSYGFKDIYFLVFKKISKYVVHSNKYLIIDKCFSRLRA
jgi:hypothetical protein